MKRAIILVHKPDGNLKWYIGKEPDRNNIEEINAIMNAVSEQDDHVSFLPESVVSEILEKWKATEHINEMLN
jgi:hypothetical protein